MNRVSVLISFILTVLIGLASIHAAQAIEAVDVKADVKVLDLTAVVESYDGDGDRLQVSTAPGSDGIVRRIEVRARQQGVPPGWFVFALANNTDRQMDRYLVVPHFRMSGSGLLKPDLGAQRVFAISTSQGFAPERIADTEADVFRVTLDPGNVVTFVGEQSHASLPALTLWQPEAYKDYVNSYTFYRGIVLGIAGLLALFLIILFVVKGAAMFPAAALLAWSVLAYLAIDFGFMGRLFDIPTAYEPIWRAVAEVAFSASILILLFTYLTLHRWHVRYLHASGIWLIFLIVVLGIAFYDPSLGAGIARLSMVVTSVAGFAVILYLSFTGFDRAIMLIPTWILLLLWLLASAFAATGVLDNDLVQPALSGGLVLLVLLFCFTIMQHAFSGGILAQGIVSDSERRALAIVGSGDLVWDWDVPRDRIHTANDVEKLLGLKRSALDGNARNWLEYLHPQDKDRFSAMLDAIIEQRRGRVNQDFRLRAEDGHYRWFKLRARPVVGTDGEVVRCVGTLLDITDQRTAESRLLHDAVHDNLTGLANRGLLHDRLAAAMVRTQAEGAAKPAILLVDIDNFRQINDSYGLSIGDSLLLTVARRLTRLLKPQDSIARFYGDQFAIILISEQQPERIAVFADSVRKVLKVPIVFGERELTLSVSIGIAIHDVQQHKEAGDIVNDSELALYHAKRMGGDRIEPFRPSLRQQGRGRGSLDKDLVAALDRNEIEVVFQPIVDLDDRMIKGFEALARWNHPQRGTVPPSDFIPAAERTGLIVPMGIHVMEQAARKLNQWQQKLEGTEKLFMSVNVSSQQLLRHDLISDVKTILSRSNVNPGTLKLELTESLVMENPEYASQALGKLRALGAGLSLDDFGTGYSSLSYLQHFPFDTIKIDKSFVGHQRGATPIILQSIIKLAQDLRLNLVAEGVENEEAVKQLTSMGCPMGQGYLFGKPLAPVDAEGLLIKQAEQAKLLREEALARRKQMEAEAAARKAEEERKAREEQRRREAEELERKQAHARAVAAQSLPKAQPQQPAQNTKPAVAKPEDPLEAQLAASLAADLVSNGQKQPANAKATAVQPSGAKPPVEARGQVPPAAPKQPVALAAKQGAPNAPKQVPQSIPQKPSSAKQANADEGENLDLALEAAIGSAAQEALAEQLFGAPASPEQTAANAPDAENGKSGAPQVKAQEKPAPMGPVIHQPQEQNRAEPPQPPKGPSLPKPQPQLPVKQDAEEVEAASPKAAEKRPQMPPVVKPERPDLAGDAEAAHAVAERSEPSGKEPGVKQMLPVVTDASKPEKADEQSEPSGTAPEPKSQEKAGAADAPSPVSVRGEHADNVERLPEQRPEERKPEPQAPKHAPGKAVASERSEGDPENGLPFAMPDMSDIDQDIAAAIQQAMLGSKKS